MSRRLSFLGVEFSVAEGILAAVLVPFAVYCLWLFCVTYLVLFDVA